MKLIQHGRRWHPRRERCRSRLGGSATANFRLKMPDARSKRSGSDDFVHGKKFGNLGPPICMDSIQFHRSSLFMTIHESRRDKSCIYKNPISSVSSRFQNVCSELQCYHPQTPRLPESRRSARWSPQASISGILWRDSVERRGTVRNSRAFFSYVHDSAYIKQGLRYKVIIYK